MSDQQFALDTARAKEIAAQKGTSGSTKFILRPGARVKHAAERMERYIAIPETGCWLWLGNWDRNKYGVSRIAEEGKHLDTRKRLMHRMFYEHHKGPIPEGLCVCHKCDTPPCVNPDHLFLGTWEENQDDRTRKGRKAGEWSCKAKLNWRLVDEIRASSGTHAALAVRFGVGETAIRNVRSGKTWSGLRVAR